MRENKYKLVHINDNYADEINVTGFIALPEEDWQKFVTQVKQHMNKAFPITYTAGSNQYITHTNIHSFMRVFTVVDISAAQFWTLKPLFQSYRNQIWNGFTKPYDNMSVRLDEPEDEADEGE